MREQSGSGQSSALGSDQYDPQAIISWVRTAKPNDLIEVGKTIFSRVGDLSTTDQKMFFEQLNQNPSTSKLLQQYTHA